MARVRVSMRRCWLWGALFNCIKRGEEVKVSRQDARRKKNQMDRNTVPFHLMYIV